MRHLYPFAGVGGKEGGIERNVANVATRDVEPREILGGRSQQTNRPMNQSLQSCRMTRVDSSQDRIPRIGTMPACHSDSLRFTLSVRKVGARGEVCR